MAPASIVTSKLHLLQPLYRMAVDDNLSLTDIEEFSYLRSLLLGGT